MTNKNNNLIYAATKEVNMLLTRYHSNAGGIKESRVESARKRYGDNKIVYANEYSLGKKLFKAFIDPFTVILLALAAVSVFTDVIMPDADSDFTTVVIIATMVLISGSLRFIQEEKSGNAAEKLQNMIITTTCVERRPHGREEIPLDDVVVGDIVHLAAGDIIPADIRLFSTKDLFISQSSLTGESEPIEKIGERLDNDGVSPLEMQNLAFMGTNVISGSATGIVIATGQNTIFGEIAKTIQKKPAKTSFEKGVNSVSWILIRFMFVMVPVVLFVNGFTKGDWFEAFLFAVSVAVGLTPEMLPMIVTSCLAKGAVTMSKKKTIIKNMNAIQGIGAMNILCTDKTGTLTQDKVVLTSSLDIHGNKDNRVLRHGFLNSFYQTGYKNLMDIAIINETNERSEGVDQLKDLDSKYEKIDEIPFDFERRRMSVVICDKNDKTQMITKGAVEEMLSICTSAEYKGEVIKLSETIANEIKENVNNLNNEGLRVLAVAQKTNPSPVGEFSVTDESEMVLMGYLAFLDPPKESAEEAIQALKDHNVDVKILTGDNEIVTRHICKKLNINVNEILSGSQLDDIDEEDLPKTLQRISVFAKLSPEQKSKVISILQKNGNTVGYMGDGINDVMAMKAADIGISVDTAVDIAKETANVILLEKDLMVLEEGIIEGRKTFANMLKYIKMTASSNFGNMFSVLVAGAFLPFMPMMSIHLLLLNLIYDISCIAVPWDNVDKEYLTVPKDWDAKSIGKFMIWIGPVSSVFDITTYLFMYFIICPRMTGGLLYTELSDPAMMMYYVALFQAGWFVESMWSQTLVIHMIRTDKLPFIQSRASGSLTLLTFTGIGILTIIPFTGFGASIGLAPLPVSYFGWLAATIFAYMLLITMVKKLYIRKYGELL